MFIVSLSIDEKKKLIVLYQGQGPICSMYSVCN